ncbi:MULTISPECIES: ATP-binding protein [unclassified Massilia]|uniref:ATP-binding protein n=1 Tax=unclassified Massilia TaxID=2609279 RepID=UPI0017852E48|nr:MULTISPECIES: ATP-binding protein [unclassified Massilia]MBD8532147.1 response regulator [Massilia sp. CFBP 13647]MBD8675595.1 response regulator [Massilia sp. CFBP 13721]
MTDPRKSDWPVSVAICAPFAHDAPALARLFRKWGAWVCTCASAEEVGAAISDRELTLVVFTEEVLEAYAAPLAAALGGQPAWSDLPLIVLSSEAVRAGAGNQWRFLRQFANLTVLQRPCSADLLYASFESACRTRAWQYTVRDQMQTLTAAATLLEQRVLERTSQLMSEVETRKRVESALNESRKLEALGRLTGGVAHDFNNLLQVVQGSATLLPLVKPGSEAFQRALGAIERAATRGAKLTQQLLAFGRRQALAPGALDIARQLDEAAGLLQQSLREQITLTLEVAPGLWHADADLTQLEVALLNLTVNARDAMPGGGQVVIGARNMTLPAPGLPTGLTGDFVWLTVADSGAGMAPEVAQQAFEPFFTTKPVGAGTGLGLSQVYGFAVQSGGSAWIDTSATGTTVSILLPRSTQDAVSGAAGASGARPAMPARGGRVLYVEDDPDVAEAGMAVLDVLGCKAILVRDAAAALEQPLAQFDLVFSDVMMPGEMDGIDLAREIRRRHPGLPVVLASGYMIAPERLAGLNIGVLTKPYSQEALRQAFAGLMAVAPAPAAC